MSKQCRSMWRWGSAVFRCGADEHTLEQTLHCYVYGSHFIVEWDDTNAFTVDEWEAAHAVQEERT